MLVQIYMIVQPCQISSRLHDLLCDSNMQFVQNMKYIPLFQMIIQPCEISLRLQYMIHCGLNALQYAICTKYDL